MAKPSSRKKTQDNFSWVALILLVLVIFFVAINLVPGNTAELSSTLPLDISAQEAYSYREDGAFILDVRTQEEWDAGHIPGATLIPLDELPDRLSEVPRNVEIVVVCRSGNRSQQGRDILLNAGFPSVTSMDGGVNAWQGSGFPFE